jgi:predicted lactoylglutathione lyase
MSNKPKQIFVNLPVKDLERSKAFFAKLGYTFNPQFTDENAACMVISETIFAMLLVQPYFQTFTPKKVADAKSTAEVLLALSCESRQEVQRIVDTALAAGGKEYKEPQDHGFMFVRVFEDLDGHCWEYLWMDPAHVQQ